MNLFCQINVIKAKPLHSIIQYVGWAYNQRCRIDLYSSLKLINMIKLKVNELSKVI